MPGTLSQATSERYERHQRTVEQLDQDFQPYDLHFLLSLPDHKSVLTNFSKTKGVMLGIRAAKEVLKALKSERLQPPQVRLWLASAGETILK